MVPMRFDLYPRLAPKRMGTIRSTPVAGGADPGSPSFDAEARGDHVLHPVTSIGSAAIC
jgi:hypothetical protein